MSPAWLDSLDRAEPFASSRSISGVRDIFFGSIELSFKNESVCRISIFRDRIAAASV
jgi:hypothetical protein